MIIIIRGENSWNDDFLYNLLIILRGKKNVFKSLQVDEGLVYSKRCAELENNPFVSKAYISLGVGYCLKADEAKLQVQRQEWQTKALSLFVR